MVLLGGGAAMLAGALYYMVSSTLALSALSCWSNSSSATRAAVAAMLAVTAEAYGFGDEELDAEEPAAELALPGTMPVLGLCFAACALLLAGLPPLSGFVGKFAMLSGMLNPGGLGAGDPAVVPLVAWVHRARHPLGARGADRHDCASASRPSGCRRGGGAAVLLVEIAPVVALLARDLGDRPSRRGR